MKEIIKAEVIIVNTEGVTALLVHVGDKCIRSVFYYFSQSNGY